MRTVSSSLTFFNKYLFLIIWSGMFGLGTLTMFLSRSVDNPPKYQFLVAWIFGTIFIYLICGRIKKVQIDGSKVIISNFISSDEITISQIISVSGSVFLTPEFVWFKVKEPTKFGTTIIF